MDELQTFSEADDRELSLQINDLRTGHTKVDIRLPVNLAAVALQSRARLLPIGHDHGVLARALADGSPLKLEVDDAAHGERIVIIIK